jgi:hypothetical protein
VFRAFYVACITAAASGCCAFGPCDRITAFAGRVVMTVGAPVSGAKVSVFGIHTVTDLNGCFNVGGVDGLPQQLSVEARGFEPLSVRAKSGIYQVAVVIAIPNSTDSSEVRWSKSDIRSLKAVPGCT